MAKRQPYPKPALVFNNRNIHIQRSVVDSMIQDLSTALYIAYTEENNTLLVATEVFDKSDQVWAKPADLYPELYNLQSNGNPRKNLVTKTLDQDMDVAIKVKWP